MGYTHLQSMLSIFQPSLPFNHPNFPLSFLFSDLAALLDGCISFLPELLLVLYFNCHISLYFDHLPFQELLLLDMLINYSVLLLDLYLKAVFFEGHLSLPVLLRLFGLDDVLLLPHDSRPSLGLLPNLYFPFLSFHPHRLLNPISFGLDQLVSPFNLHPQLADLSFVVLLLSGVAIEFGLVEAAFFIELTVVASESLNIIDLDAQDAMQSLHLSIYAFNTAFQPVVAALKLLVFLSQFLNISLQVGHLSLHLLNKVLQSSDLIFFLNQ